MSHCPDCHRRLFQRKGPSLGPIVHEYIWRALVDLSMRHRTLCVDCMQKRMHERFGRAFYIDDLTPCPFNVSLIIERHPDNAVEIIPQNEEWGTAFRELILRRIEQDRAMSNKPDDEEVTAWLRLHPVPDDDAGRAAHAEACRERFPGITPHQYATLIVCLMSGLTFRPAGASAKGADVLPLRPSDNSA